MNPVPVQMRAVAQNLGLYRCRFRQVGKGAVMHASEAGHQRMLQLQINFWSYTQHLQAADLRLEAGQRFSQQGQVVNAQRLQHAGEGNHGRRDGGGGDGDL